MAKSKSEFLQWFEAQFGKCPMSVKHEQAARDKLQDLKYNAKLIEETLKAVDEWEVNFSTALYAWNAREGKNG